MSGDASVRPVPELLSDADSTRDWLLASGLAVPSVTVDEEERQRLVTFRHLVRALIDANMSGEQDREANAELARLVAGHPVPVTAGLDGQVGLDLEPVESVIRHALPPPFGYLTLLRYALPKVPRRGGPEPGSGAVNRHVSRSPRDERQYFWIGPAEAVSIRYSRGR